MGIRCQQLSSVTVTLNHKYLHPHTWMRGKPVVKTRRAHQSNTLFNLRFLECKKILAPDSSMAVPQTHRAEGNSHLHCETFVLAAYPLAPAVIAFPRYRAHTSALVGKAQAS